MNILRSDLGKHIVQVVSLLAKHYPFALPDNLDCGPFLNSPLPGYRVRNTNGQAVKSPDVVWEFVNPFVQLSRSRLRELLWLHLRFASSACELLLARSCLSQRRSSPTH